MGLGNVLSTIARFVGEQFVDDLKDRFDDSLNDAKGKVHEALEEFKIKLEALIAQALKRVLIFSLVLIGLIFALVGLGTYLSERVTALSDGVGFIVIGGALILISAFGSYLLAR